MLNLIAVLAAVVITSVVTLVITVASISEVIQSYQRGNSDKSDALVLVASAFLMLGLAIALGVGAVSLLRFPSTSHTSPASASAPSYEGPQFSRVWAVPPRAVLGAGTDAGPAVCEEAGCPQAPAGIVAISIPDSPFAGAVAPIFDGERLRAIAVWCIAGRQGPATFAGWQVVTVFGQVPDGAYLPYNAPMCSGC